MKIYKQILEINLKLNKFKCNNNNNKMMQFSWKQIKVNINNYVNLIF